MMPKTSSVALMMPPDSYPHFKGKMSKPLSAEMHPIVQRALNDAGAFQNIAVLYTNDNKSAVLNLNHTHAPPTQNTWAQLRTNLFLNLNA